MELGFGKMVVEIRAVLFICEVSWKTLNRKTKIVDISSLPFVQYDNIL